MNEEQYFKIEGWLKSIDTRLDNIESKFSQKQAFQTNNLKQIPGIEKLAKQLNVSIDDIYYIINFEENDNFIFLFEICGKNETEKQLNATLCYLTVLYHCFGKNEVSSKVLNQKLQLWGIKSLNNLSGTLKRNKRYVVSKGVAGSSNFNYTITIPGMGEGIKLLSTFLNKNGKE